MNINQITNVTNGSKNGSHPILVGLLYTFGIVMISALIFALLLYFTSVSDSHLPLISYIVTAVSLLVGGFISGKHAEARGWYYGGMIGIIYGITLAVIAFLALDAGLNLKSLVLIILAFLFGALGGIFGVNSKK